MSSHTQPKGQSLAEYALIVALIAIVCLSALSTLGASIQTGFGSLASAIGGVMGGGGNTGSPITSLPLAPTPISSPAVAPPPDIGGSPDSSCTGCSSEDNPNPGDGALL